MVQQLRILTALAKNPGSVPSTYTWRLTAAYRSSSRDFNTLFLSSMGSMHVAHGAHKIVQTHSHISITTLKIHKLGTKSHSVIKKIEENH